jgi:DNA-binding MarR family transcriptional regulator
MVASTTPVPLGELAQTLFDIITRFCMASPRGRRRNGALKELEFLTLSILHQHPSLIVGDIQRQLGILPAQMSRIIRSLEARERPLISCRINSQDKRKIDVALTPSGTKAFLEYQSARIHNILVLLARLPDEDLEGLHRLLDKINELIDPPTRA